MSDSALPEIQRKIQQANGLLAIAEQELKMALAELQVFERADKKMISAVIQAAFEKLAVAKSTLASALELGSPPG